MFWPVINYFNDKFNFYHEVVSRSFANQDNFNWQIIRSSLGVDLHMVLFLVRDSFIVPLIFGWHSRTFVKNIPIIRPPSYYREIILLSGNYLIIGKDHGLISQWDYLWEMPVAHITPSTGHFCIILRQIYFQRSIYPWTVVLTQQFPHPGCQPVLWQPPTGPSALLIAVGAYY
jgi:hypothetical protein